MNTPTPLTDALVKENEDCCTRVEKQIEESAKRLRALNKGHVVDGCAHVSIDTETLRSYFAHARTLEWRNSELQKQCEELLRNAMLKTKNEAPSAS